MIDTPDTAKLAEPLQAPAFERDIVLAAKGGAITFAGRLFTLGSRFVIAFILARILGAGEYGFYNLTLSAIAVATGIALFGLDIALVRYIPVFARRRDEAGLWGALQIAVGLTSLLSILIAIALYAFAVPIAEQRFHDPKLAPLLRLASLVVPFLTLSTVVGAATQGFKKMQYATIAQNIVQPLIRLVLVIALAIVGLNAAGAVAIFGVAVVAGCGVLIYFLNNLFSLKRPLHTARRDTREMMRFSLSVYLSDLMILFQNNIQTLLLGALNTIVSVGRFAVADQINLIGSMFQGSITTAARPIIAELYDRGDRQQMGRVYQTTTKWMVTFNLPLFLILILFPAQILSIFGKSFVEGSTALILLSWAKMVDIGTGTCGAVIDMTGYTGLKLLNGIVQLALSLGMSVLLIPRWGIIGAASAVLIAISAINLLRLSEVFILFRLLPYNVSFIKPMTAGFAAMTAALGVNYLLSMELNVLRTGISIFVLISVYVGTILLLGLSPEDRALLARVRRRMGMGKERKK